MADESLNNELLISSVKHRPVLWDKSADFYKNRVATRMAWKEIMVILNPDIETKGENIRQAYVKQIIHRWTHIRDNYYRSCKKIEDQKRSGSGGRSVKPYVYSKHLTFLQKVFQPRDTKSNSITEYNTESENETNHSEGSETSEDNNTLHTNDMVIINPKPKKRPMNNEVNVLDAKMVKYMDSCEHKTINRHLSFFNGILPSLDNFNEDEVLEFQMGVLQLVKKIKSCKQNRASSSFNGNYADPLIEQDILPKNEYT